MDIDLKRGRLRVLAESAKEAGVTLQKKLTQELSLRMDAVASGSAISRTSGNGESVEFSIPGAGSHGPDKAAALISEFIDLYDAAKAQLVLDGSLTPTDDQILTEMLQRLEPVYDSYNDFSGLRS